MSDPVGRGSVETLPAPHLITRRAASARAPEAWWGVVFVAPVVLLFLLLRAAPAFTALYFSLTDFSAIGSPRWIGVGNYLALLNDELFRTALTNTVLYATGTVIPTTLLAMGFALLLNQRLPGIAVYRMAFYSPVVVSLVSISMMWAYMLNSQFGVVNYALSLVHLPRLGWLDDPRLALPSIILIGIWKNLGYSIVVYLATLQAVPGEYHEAATVDGAGTWQRFRWITWPLLVPTTVFVVMMTGIFAFQAFDQILVLTGGGPANATTTVVFEIYRNAFQFLKMGYASAMAFVLFVLIFAASLLALWLGSGRFRY